MEGGTSHYLIHMAGTWPKHTSENSIQHWIVISFGKEDRLSFLEQTVMSVGEDRSDGTQFLGSHWSYRRKAPSDILCDVCE